MCVCVCVCVYKYTLTLIQLVKNPVANPGDPRDASSSPMLGRSPGEGNGNSLQYSCLGNPMDTGTWHITVHGVTKNQLSTADLAQHNSHIKITFTC